MPIPEYEELADALLAFVYLNGGDEYEVRAGSTYEPLAEFFALSQVERSRPRPDGYSGSDWHNKVQWTRQRLINHGLLYGPQHGFWRRGVWRLTRAGISRASLIAHKHRGVTTRSS